MNDLVISKSAECYEMLIRNQEARNPVYGLR